MLCQTESPFEVLLNRHSYSNVQSASHLNTQAENLNRTIHLLADRTNPISVDNFYYLIDQMDPQDGIPYTNALDLAKYFLETGQSCLAKFGKTCNPSDLRSLHSVFLLGATVLSGKWALSDLHSPYLLGVIPVRQGMAVRMETHRGCSYRCPFCRHSGGMNTIQAVGTEQRFREELELFRDNNISKINVLNPLFNNKEDYKVLLDLVKELHIEIPLSVQIRCEALTDDFLPQSVKKSDATLRKRFRDCENCRGIPSTVR